MKCVSTPLRSRIGESKHSFQKGVPSFRDSQTVTRAERPSATAEGSREEEVAADDLVAAVAPHSLECLVGVDDRAAGLGGVGEDDPVARRVNRQIAKPEARQHGAPLVVEEGDPPDDDEGETSIGEALPEPALLSSELEAGEGENAGQGCDLEGSPDAPADQGEQHHGCVGGGGQVTEIHEEVEDEDRRGGADAQGETTAIGEPLS